MPFLVPLAKATIHTVVRPLEYMKHRAQQRQMMMHASKLALEKNPELAEVIQKNIDLIDHLKQQALEHRTLQDRFADCMTDFSGSMAFFYTHIVWFGIWIVLNNGWIPGVKAFDPFPYGLLTMVVSLEAIFLSTFVLISQNRQGAITERQNALDLQIDLLAEYEITRMLRLVDKMAEKMGIEDAYDKEIDQLCEPVAPDVVLREIERRQAKQI